MPVIVFTLFACPICLSFLYQPVFGGTFCLHALFLHLCHRCFQLFAVLLIRPSLLSICLAFCVFSLSVCLSVYRRVLHALPEAVAYFLILPALLVFLPTCFPVCAVRLRGRLGGNSRSSIYSSSIYSCIHVPLWIVCLSVRFLYLSAHLSGYPGCSGICFQILASAASVNIHQSRISVCCRYPDFKRAHDKSVRDSRAVKSACSAYTK